MGFSFNGARRTFGRLRGPWTGLPRGCRGPVSTPREPRIKAPDTGVAEGSFRERREPALGSTPRDEVGRESARTVMTRSRLEARYRPFSTVPHARAAGGRVRRGAFLAASSEPRSRTRSTSPKAEGPASRAPEAGPSASSWVAVARELRRVAVDCIHQIGLTDTGARSRNLPRRRGSAIKIDSRARGSTPRSWDLGRSVCEFRLRPTVHARSSGAPVIALPRSPSATTSWGGHARSRLLAASRRFHVGRPHMAAIPRRSARGLRPSFSASPPLEEKPRGGRREGKRRKPREEGKEEPADGLGEADLELVPGSALGRCSSSSYVRTLRPEKSDVRWASPERSSPRRFAAGALGVVNTERQNRQGGAGRPR